MGELVADGDRIFGLVQAINLEIEKRCNRFLIKRYSLTVPQYRLLMAAVEGRGTTMGALAENISCTRGNLTGVVDRLERDGWLVRERNHDDRRVVTLRLTAKGKGIREIHEALMAQVGKITEVWTSEERVTLAALLLRLLDEEHRLEKAG